MMEAQDADFSLSLIHCRVLAARSALPAPEAVLPLTDTTGIRWAYVLYPRPLALFHDTCTVKVAIITRSWRPISFHSQD